MRSALPGSASPGLVASGLGRSYGARPIFSELDLCLTAGQYLAVTGANGAGKTTLLRVLAGVSLPTQGQVFLHGVSLSTGPHALRREIGYVGHLPFLYADLTGYENLLFFARLYNVPAARVTSLLAAVGMADAGHKPVHNYSRGMQQRLALARALLHEPSLLILDEPLTGLDAGGRAMFFDLLAAHRQGGGMAVAAGHDETLAAAADAQLTLGGGRKGWCALSAWPSPGAAGPGLSVPAAGPTVPPAVAVVSTAAGTTPPDTAGVSLPDAALPATVGPDPATASPASSATASPATTGAARPPLPGFLRQFWFLVGADLLGNWRNLASLATIPLFALLVLLVFGLTLRPGERDLDPLLPGLLWTGLAFAALSGQTRPFLRERLLGAVEGLMAAPVDRAAVYMGRLTAAWLIVFGVGSIMTPLFFAFLGWQGPPVPTSPLALTLAVGTLAMTAVAVFAATLSVQGQGGEGLLSLLALPLLLPVLMAVVQVTEGLLAGRPAIEWQSWFRLLVACGILFSMLPAVLHDYLMEV